MVIFNPQRLHNKEQEDDSEWWISKDMDGSHSDHLRYYPNMCLEGLTENRKTSDRITILQAKKWSSSPPSTK
jgi:hypothetical protein